MTIGERLHNSYKAKMAVRAGRRVLALPALLYRRMTLGRRLRATPVLRIHLGCGPIDDARFLNVDARAFPHVHYVTKSAFMPALPTGRAEMIYACHVFEHLPWPMQRRVLERWHALLAPGGELRLSVPDFEKLVDLYQRKAADFFAVENALMGGQDYPENFHCALFTADHLAGLLTKAGFTNVGPWHAGDQDNWPRDWSWNEKISLNLRAEKPR